MSINSPLRVAVLPIDIVDADKGANLKSLTDGIAKIHAGVDLIVLPELFSTGFISDPQTAKTIAETDEGETMALVKSLASTYNTAICGSFLAKDDDRLYNRGFIVEPSGESVWYDKRHLFCLSEESKTFSAGDKLPPVARFRGWNICLAICYDLRFPAWLRNTNIKYDLLVLPANWPESRSFAWTHLLQARAIENVSYVIGANRSGEDRYGKYDGMSEIYDFMGRPVSTQVEDTLIVTATLDKSLLKTQRQRFPVWRDADEFRFID